MVVNSAILLIVCQIVLQAKAFAAATKNKALIYLSAVVEMRKFGEEGYR